MYSRYFRSRQALRRALPISVLCLFAALCFAPKAGAGWTTITMSPNKIRTVSFTSPEHGYAAGERGLYRTADAGATWTLQPTPLDSLDGARAWPGDNGDVLYIVAKGGKRAAYSADGGATWNVQETTLAGGFILGSYSYDRNTFFISGSEHTPNGDKTGVIISTNNAGATWTKVTIPGTYLISKVHFINADEGYAVGTSTSAISDGLIFKTTDGGTTWQQQFRQTIKQLNAVYALDENTAIAAGFEGLIYRTDNGGETWEQVDAGAGTGAVLEAITFLNENDGYISGFGRIVVTRDGGHTWSHAASASMFTMIEDLTTVGDIAYAAGTALDAADMQGFVMKSDALPRPAIYLTKEEIDLGETGEGETVSVELDILPDNDAPLTVSDIRLRTADGAPTSEELGLSLAIGTELPVVLYSGEFLTVTVTLTGAVPGALDAELVIASSDEQQPETVLPVRAVVTSSARPTLVLNTTGISFGSLHLGETTSFDLRIEAGSAAALTVSDIALQAASGTPEELGLSIGTDRALPATLATGDVLTATVTLTALAPGPVDAAVVITSNDETSPTTTLPISASVATTDIADAAATPPALRTYPNPADRTAAVAFSVPVGGAVRVELLNALGERVAVPFDSTVPAGEHTVTIPVGALPSGFYICRLTTQEHSVSQRLLIAR